MATMAPNYVFTSTHHERKRLAQQAGAIADITRRVFAQAGLREGMRVLDVGCGVGDVSFLVAEAVGPSGSVVGLDMNGESVAQARGRALEAGLTNVAFVQSELGRASFTEPFDAAVCRLFLMHQPDPVAALGEIAAHVRPGGTVASIEFDLTVPALTFPECPTAHEAIDVILDTFVAAGVQMDMGRNLPATFTAAGLPLPGVSWESRVGFGPDSPVYEWCARTAVGVLPMAERLGVPVPQDLDAATLTAAIRDEVLAANAVLIVPPLVGVWAQVP